MNNPLTEQDIVICKNYKAYILKHFPYDKVQSAKRMLKQKTIELDKQNAKDSLTCIANPNYDNGFHDACLLFRAELIDACFQIPDGDD
jgi:hypothetical protein